MKWHTHTHTHTLTHTHARTHAPTRTHARTHAHTRARACIVEYRCMGAETIFCVPDNSVTWVFGVSIFQSLVSNARNGACSIWYADFGTQLRKLLPRIVGGAWGCHFTLTCKWTKMKSLAAYVVYAPCCFTPSLAAYVISVPCYFRHTLSFLPFFLSRCIDGKMTFFSLVTRWYWAPRLSICREEDVYSYQNLILY